MFWNKKKVYNIDHPYVNDETSFGRNATTVNTIPIETDESTKHEAETAKKQSVKCPSHNNTSIYFSLGVAIVGIVVAVTALVNIYIGLSYHDVIDKNLIDSYNSTTNVHRYDLQQIQEKIMNLSEEIQIQFAATDAKIEKQSEETIKQIWDNMKFLQSTTFLVQYCGVGIRNWKVPNSHLTSSSSTNAGGGDHSAYYARLDFGGGAYPITACWAPNSISKYEWIQVDLQARTRVTGVVTQGRGDGTYQTWVTSYKITYGDVTSSMETFQSKSGGDQIFSGNTNKHGYKMNKFPDPITARYFRLYPQTWHGVITLRMEYITC